MNAPSPAPSPDEVSGAPAGVSEVSADRVRVRYWAAARAAVGVAEERLEVAVHGEPLAAVLARVTDGRDARVARVVAICSVLLDEQAVHVDGDEVLVRPGAVLDLLPPFAGG